jgi:hypothetical protein
MGAWNQESLANSFNTMALTSQVVTNGVTRSGASNHTTSFYRPSSIIIGNRLALLVTSVGGSVLSSPFYLNTILVTPDTIEKIMRLLFHNWQFVFHEVGPIWPFHDGSFYGEHDHQVQ